MYGFDHNKSRSARVIFVEFLNKILSMPKVLDGFPGVIFSWISFPIDNVLHLPSSRALEFFNMVFLFTLYPYG